MATLRTYDVTRVEELIKGSISEEIEALFSLCHRNVLRFYTKTYHEGKLAIVAEDAGGGSLENAIKSRYLDWSNKSHIAEQIAHGLKYLHRKKIIYRGLRSTCVLLTDADMTVKLCDFGIPTIKDVIASKNPKGREAEAVRWMAPELLTTSQPVYSYKSDVYALGVVMWEMAASCTVPFRGQPDDRKVMEWVIGGRRERLPVDTPPEYRLYVQQCWDQDAHKRPSAADLVSLSRDMASDDDGEDSFSSSSTLSITESLVRRLNIDSPSPPSSTCSTPNSLQQIDRQPATGRALAGQSTTDSSQNEFRALLHKAERGIVNAQVEVASRFMGGGAGVVKSEYLAYTWYRRAAEQGHAEAQYQLGECLNLGRAVSQNHAEAALWYLKAANQGNAAAQMALGWAYRYGRGVDQDDLKAVEWFCRAADQHHADAQFNLGMILREGGREIKQNKAEAASWFRKSAINGHVHGQYYLANMYHAGQGLEQCDVKAAFWYHKAAEQGVSAAQLSLARMYESGTGTVQSDVDAAFWYRKAAQQGVVDAQFRLGEAYEYGLGIEYSAAEAISWYQMAADQGHLQAKICPSIRTNTMTTKEVSGDATEIRPTEIPHELKDDEKAETGVSATTDTRKEKAEEKKSVPFWDLFRFASKKDWILIGLGFFSSIVVGVGQPLFAALNFGNIVNQVYSPTYGNSQSDAVTHAALLFFLSGLIIMIAAYFQSCLWTIAAENQVRRIRESYLHAILRQDIGWHDAGKNESESFTTRLSGDAEMIYDGIADKCGMTICNFATFIAGFAVAFAQAWKLSLVVMALVPLLAFTGALMAIVIRRSSTKSLTAYSCAGAIAEQAIGSIRTVVSFGGQQREQRDYAKHLDDAYAAGFRKAFATGSGNASFVLILFSAHALAFWYGSELVGRGEISPGQIIAVFFAMVQGAYALGRVGPNFGSFAAAQGAAFSIYQTIDRVPTIDTANPGGAKPSNVQGHVVLKDVDFAYPARPDVQVLYKMNVEVKPGETIALVGQSGSGKSTIVGLVERFYDPL
ncbi:ATP-binding cassette, sub-B (MDR TAP), member 4 [Actinomortierella ambigua]|nr:ATP-binding cassette, sub-B (MDR TAP), member 4 [Actinomortierella ambigua]